MTTLNKIGAFTTSSLIRKALKKSNIKYDDVRAYLKAFCAGTLQKVELDEKRQQVRQLKQIEIKVESLFSSANSLDSFFKQAKESFVNKLKEEGVDVNAIDEIYETTDFSFYNEVLTFEVNVDVLEDDDTYFERIEKVKKINLLVDSHDKVYQNALRIKEKEKLQNNRIESLEKRKKEIELEIRELQNQ